jgi:hypothetical protein
MKTKHSEKASGGQRARAAVESRLEYLRRLSIVFASELRISIVTQLYLREMSAKQFHEEFGGGSIPRVDRHFKKLAKYDWLHHVRSETGGRRRGATEHFYRAPKLAIFDNETWALVPYSMRVALSWKTFKIFAERVRDALKAGTLDARPESHLSWTAMMLDQLGWERVVAVVGGLFESIFEEQNAARERMSRSGEKPIVTTIGLAVFESPSRSARAEREHPRLERIYEESPVPLSRRVSKVFADELCLKIVTEANVREISAPLFYAELGAESIGAVRRRFRMLEEIGWLKRTRRETGGARRGATEYFYRASGPAIFDREEWAEVPDSAKPTYSWKIFKSLAERVKDAIVAGTLEARLDSHLSWSVLRLDQQGWERVIAAVDSSFALVTREWEQAEARLAESGESPIPTTVALAAFESPQDGAKAP